MSGFVNRLTVMSLFRSSGLHIMKYRNTYTKKSITWMVWIHISQLGRDLALSLRRISTYRSHVSPSVMRWSTVRTLKESLPIL